MSLSIDKILSQFITFSEKLINTPESKLVSFSFSIDNLISQLSIDNLNEKFYRINLFYFPNSRQRVIGLNSAIEFSSKKEVKFSSLPKQIDKWKDGIINNWSETGFTNPYLIFCSAKFDTKSSSDLWNDFDQVSFYVPQFVIIAYQEKTIGYFNFIPDTTFKNDSLQNILKEYLNSLIYSKNKITASSLLKDSFTNNSGRDEFLSWDLIALKAIDKLKSEELDKIVLSRSHKFGINSTINWDSLLEALQNRFPDCYLFFIKNNDSIFFGSSPEMFLRVSDGIAEVESVAGSAARGKKIESDIELEKFLKSSEKNHREHLYVTEYITDILVNYSNKVRVIEEKQIRKLDNIQHLLTKISAELNPGTIIFEMIDSLFPTPAVCGVPKSKALDAIKNLESHDRGLYSGLVGVFDFSGNCELAVSIRSAIVKDMQVTAFAGAGLVKNSDPQEEFQETNLKLNTILSLFTNENKSKQK